MDFGVLQDDSELLSNLEETSWADGHRNNTGRPMVILNTQYSNNVYSEVQSAPTKCGTFSDNNIEVEFGSLGKYRYSDYSKQSFVMQGSSVNMFNNQSHISQTSIDPNQMHHFRTEIQLVKDKNMSNCIHQTNEKKFIDANAGANAGVKSQFRKCSTSTTQQNYEDQMSTVARKGTGNIGKNDMFTYDRHKDFHVGENHAVPETIDRSVVIKDELGHMLDDIERTMCLFPFVCGLCFEKFDKITEYYVHLRNHPENVEPYFHTCYSQDIESKEKTLPYYVCRNCSFACPSLCFLHEHLVDVECMSVYKISAKTRTAYPCSEVTDTDFDETLNEGSNYYIKEAEYANTHKTGKNDFAETFDKIKDNAVNEKEGPMKIHIKQKLDEADVKRKRKASSKITRKIKYVKNNLKTEIRIGETRPNYSIETALCDDAVDDQVVETVDNETKKATEHDFDNDVKTNVDGIIDAVKECDSAGESTDVEIVAETKTKKKKQYPLMTDEQGRRVYANHTYLPCEKCGVNVLRCRITKHMTIHRDTRDFHCAECGHQFKTEVEMKQHVRMVHTSENNSICQSCGKSFKNNAYLKQHEKTHAARDKKCPLCPQAFCTSALLRRHMLLHRDEKQHRCDQCGKEFTYKSSLTTHVFQVHNDARAFSCEQCDKTFKLRHGLRKHLKTHEPHQYFCNVCGKSFVCSFNMKTHMKVHSKGDN